MGNDHYTAATAAAYLGYTAKSLRRLFREGKIEGHRTSTGRIRFSKEQLDRFLQGRQNTRTDLADKP